MPEACSIGIDLGTSGCRAVAIARDRRVLAEARAGLPAPARSASGGVEQSPELWWTAVVSVLREIAAGIGSRCPASLSVDGTSSTLLLCGPDGDPLAPALMYNDNSSRAEAGRISKIAPADSPALGASSSLAKLLHLRERLNPPPGTLALHQADWVLGRLSGRFGPSDWNNCLKLGYDARDEVWPDWIRTLDIGPVRLPEALAPGTPIGSLAASVAQETGLPVDTGVVTGTTDSTAAVIAAGAGAPGDAVTCLGSTLVLKILGRRPISAPRYGVYSHRFGDLWLVGGASNSGGAVLREYFTDKQMRSLTAELKPDEPTGLDYYPLLAPGERFPIHDGGLQPRLSPRPDDKARFFQGILEGIARIEAAGYRRLNSLGAPSPTAVATIGGGAGNPAWTRIRERLLGVPVTTSAVREAAYGTALLALLGGVPG